jgi:hypothetical protein
VLIVLFPLSAQTISASLKAVNEATNQLITLAKGTSSGAAIKERELDHAMLEISSVLGPQSPTQSGATPADVMQACRMVTNGVSDLLFATGPDDVIKAAKVLLDSNFIKNFVQTHIVMLWLGRVCFWIRFFLCD